MSANINLVLLAGNLTRDPELKYIPSGQGVCTFSIAVNRSWTQDNGEKKEAVGFFRIVAWGKLGEICNEYLKKGAPVMVDGRLDSRSWDAPDGSKRTTIEVVAAHVHFLGAKPQGEAKTASKPTKAVTDKELMPDDEVPF